ncbi:MAG: hypothetical protein DRP75_02285 [Candidatus Omnitrophota bacterium]|nr:MAG: hypothetical protein DRP75_02285 [Candidatus Omnitrophota bacterium]
MLILHRYILKRFFPPLFYCLLLFTSLYIIVDLFDNIDEIIKQRWTLAFLLIHYLNHLPLILTRITPLSALLASLYCIGGLERTNEITPIKSAGISFIKIITPLIIAGVILSLLVFIINEKLVPSTVNPLPEKKEVLNDLTLYGSKNRIFYIREYNIKKNLAKDIIIFVQDKDKNIRQKIIAQEARWENGKWVFFNLLISNLNPEGERIGEPQKYQQRIINIEEKPLDFLESARRVEFISSRELRKMIKRLVSANYKPYRELTDWHYKLSFPWINLVTILLGISFGIATKGRGGIFVKIGVCLFLGLTYYGLLSITLALGKAGILFPFLSAWLPHLIFLFISFSIIRVNL